MICTSYYNHLASTNICMCVRYERAKKDDTTSRHYFTWRYDMVGGKQCMLWVYIFDMYIYRYVRLCVHVYTCTHFYFSHSLNQEPNCVPCTSIIQRFRNFLMWYRNTGVLCIPHRQIAIRYIVTLLMVFHTLGLSLCAKRYLERKTQYTSTILSMLRLAH